MGAQDLSVNLQAQVQQALTDCTPLCIIGGNSKAFYGHPSSATTPLNLSGHCGIMAYEPSELVVRVRAGTPLHVLESALAEQGQMLGFEPPDFSPHASVGGTIACGFSGPRRPFAGSARDVVLGCQLLNGCAEIVAFGGQVIKNVAGFDVSRLMVGALGQLGVLLDISLRVLPRPEAEMTVCYPLSDANAALERMQDWQRQSWPLSALCYTDGMVKARLSGSEAAIRVAVQKLGGDLMLEGEAFWQALREQQLPFFAQNQNLWRIGFPPATRMLALPGDWLLDWGGAQRWLMTVAPASEIHAAAHAQGGHAICFRSPDKSDWLRLEPALLALHQRLRQAFDPQGVFNPQRFGTEL